MMKGILEGCILKIIDKSETYGYEITEQLQGYGFTDVKEGTLYPLLLRLEKKNLIIATFKPSPLGPKRKYYHLTEEGKKYVAEFYQIWQEVTGAVDDIFDRQSVQKDNLVENSEITLVEIPVRIPAKKEGEA